MRYAVALIALFYAFAVQAEPTTPRGIVFAYECEQVNQEQNGFSCEFDDGRLTLHLLTKQQEMTDKKWKQANYEFNKIALRYIELGGNAFEVRAKFWEPNKRRNCSKVKNNSFGCSDFIAKN